MGLFSRGAGPRPGVARGAYKDLRRPAFAFIPLWFSDLSLESGKMNNYTELPSFPDLFVGGHARPHCFSADPFSSPIPAWEEVLEANREAVPMAAMKHPHSYLLDSSPCSEGQEEGLMQIRRKYGVPRSVEMRRSSEYERAPDGGDNEIAVFETYLEAGFRGVIPSLVAAVSSYFGFCPSQLTPLTWRTLMAIQVLGEFQGFSIGVHEVLYLYYFASLVRKPGFYHLRSRDGAPLVDEPSRGLRGNYPFGDDWEKRYVFVRVSGLLSYPTFWRTVDVSRPVSFSGEAVVKLAMEIPHRFRGVAFLTRNVVRLSVYVVYDEHQKGKTQKRRPFYVPPPRLARTTPRAASFSSSSPGDAEASPNQGLEAGACQRLLGEVLFLRSQVRDMMAQRDLLIQRVRVFARWEHMREWLEKRIDHWDLAGEYCRYLLLFGGAERPLGGSVRVDTPRSVVGSRFQRGHCLE
ncbi:hypothetical protein Bca101_010270 [Brassica carinata]